MDASLKGEFKTDKTKTTVVLGAESSILDDSAIMDVDMMIPTDMVDLSNPTFNAPYSDPTTGFHQVGTVINKTSGVYGQVQHSINDRVHLLGGAKLAKVDMALKIIWGAMATPQKKQIVAAYWFCSRCERQSYCFCKL